ncbi:hypothetical protein BB561_006931 [Smittium simulii]|uniref:Peptidase S1 domain-containing protein n=1 Tax=Smittium simulii TaxID=133385 RepID=A0A2T9XZW4_9FUNG|nr:hypothetical protein BB561_006931 [Smittium simulii]
MFLFTFFLCLITLKKTLGSYVNISSIYSGDGAKSTLASNVINGHDAFEGEFPFMAQIYYLDRQRNFRFKCGGSLIGDKHILTAAHCLYKDFSGKSMIPLEDMRIVVGKNERMSKKNNYKTYSVKDVNKFGYPENRAADFAIIALSANVPEEEATSIQIFGGEIQNTIPVQVLGFGSLNSDGSMPSSFLKVASVDISNSTNCSAKTIHWKNNDGMLICQESRGKNESNDSCNGDSGGPLITEYKNKYYLVGTVIIGAKKKETQKNVCGKDIVGYYARVGYYLDHIAEITEIPKTSLIL